jgi:hypothetical protein
VARKRQGWRGPDYPGEFPSLGFEVIDWIEANCAIPDRHVAGEPFLLSTEQKMHLIWEYRLDPKAVADLDTPSAAFAYVGNVLVRPQKWGKGPFSAARICAQASGPVLFAGWDADGEPTGMPWSTPHIQVTAVSEDQTKNIWRALVPMIELGAVHGEIDNTGLQQIYLPGDGLIERVTSSALSRLGARITYVEQDETHGMTEANGGHKLADTQRRNLAGTGGRWSATTNAWDPSEASQAQLDFEMVEERQITDVYVNYPKPLEGSWQNKRERRRILKHAYKGAPWVDLNRVESECKRLDAKKDPGQAERFFGNRIVAGVSQAFDVDDYKKLRSDQNEIERGRIITLGFDGSLTRDATGLVATDAETGFQVVLGVWERPLHLTDEDAWVVPVDEVDEAVDQAFECWDVWRMYADPPYWKDDINRWAGRHGDEKVVLYWTNVRKKMAYALKGFKTDMRPGVMSYGGEHADVLERHIANAVKRATAMHHDEDGLPLWLISKDGPNSPRKIDLAMAACLSWEARGDCIRSGRLNKTYTRAAW